MVAFFSLWGTPQNTPQNTPIRSKNKFLVIIMYWLSTAKTYDNYKENWKYFSNR